MQQHLTKLKIKQYSCIAKHNTEVSPLDNQDTKLGKRL